MDEKNKITQEQENQEQQQNTQQPKITSMQALPSFGEWRYDVESEPPDSLKLEYPVFADKIDEALQQGKDRNEIRKHLALAEGIALTQYSQKEINNFLGRNDKSIAKVIDAIEQQKENSYDYKRDSSTNINATSKHKITKESHCCSRTKTSWKNNDM